MYLRTLFERHKQYGFTKFVIVVPSVAIREDTLASIRLMSEHFEQINVPYYVESMCDDLACGMKREATVG